MSRVSWLGAIFVTNIFTNSFIVAAKLLSERARGTLRDFDFLISFFDSSCFSSNSVSHYFRIPSKCWGTGAHVEYDSPAIVVDPQNGSPQTIGDEGLDPSADVYIIGLDDQLDRVVFGVEELSGPLTILSDGSVSFAYLGSVRLAGITLQQAMLCTQQLLIRELLRHDLR